MSKYLDLFTGIVCILSAADVGYRVIYGIGTMELADLWFVIVMTALYGARKILDLFDRDDELGVLGK